MLATARPRRADRDWVCMRMKRAGTTSGSQRSRFFEGEATRLTKATMRTTRA